MSRVYNDRLWSIPNNSSSVGGHIHSSSNLPNDLRQFPEGQEMTFRDLVRAIGETLVDLSERKQKSKDCDCDRDCGCNLDTSRYSNEDGNCSHCGDYGCMTDGCSRHSWGD